MPKKDIKFASCILFLFISSVNYYINTHDSIHNITAPNGYHYQIIYQPGYCASPNDTCDPNQQFKVQITVQHECLPTQSLSFTFDRVVFCMYPTKYIKCTNQFTGVNETRRFTAYITMTSTTNRSHNVAVNQTINVTWIPPKPVPSLNVEGGELPEWVIYLSIASGGVVLGYIGVVFIMKIRARKKGCQEMASQRSGIS